MNLASLLKRHRTDAGLTQEELAEKAEVSARTVSDVERALRTKIYRDTAGRLADALGLEGGARTDFEQAARGPRKALTQLQLPIPPTRLIGRDRELEIVIAALAREDVRLLTLTGPGGIGKTRVATEAAHRASFPEGVFFVQLGGVDAASVVPEISRALGITGTTQPTPETIAERIGSSNALVVLDTFEHVQDAAPDIARILALCEATFLVTSREALRIRGEHEVAIPTLELPSEPAMASVMETPATALFIERALAVRPDLTIDAESADVILQICKRLNGLPLAIELAGARAKHVSLAGLLDMLDQGLSVLSGGPRDLPKRQQTMRDTVAWSYELLEPAQKDLFLDLCAFSGGWTLEAASAVCARDVLQDLSALVDKSLVVVNESRYGMLDVIREFGVESRAPGLADERHLSYYVSIGEQAEPELGQTGQHTWIDRLTAEHDNLRAALRFALARGDAGSALRLGGAVWRFWLQEGYLTEGRRWLLDALALSGDVEPALRGKALWGAAWLAYHLGEYEAAQAAGAEMTELARGSDDPVLIRNTWTIKGIVDLAFGRLPEAVEVLGRCVELLEGRRDWLYATSLLNHGMALAHARDARALGVLEDARRAYEELGDEHFAARATMYAGYALLLDGAEQPARARFMSSLIEFWELDDLWGITECLEGVAALAAARGRAEQAASIAGAAEALRETINARAFPLDRQVVDRYLADAGVGRSDPGWQQGREIGIDAAVEIALER
jgi:predicted ATPase/DNA-binding XRE family transcriptional regulator